MSAAGVQVQVAIVGAGPAGLAAARELRRAGASVLVLDEGARAGGQIFRQMPVGFAEASPAVEPPSHEAGHQLLHETEDVEVRQGSTVWEIAPGLLQAEVDGRSLRVEAGRILLAPGATDRMLAFPGWTLPGVISAGAAQVMVRGQAIQPGQRAVVAGTGPLLLPTLTALHRAGVEVVAALDSNGRLGQLAALPALLRSGYHRREALYYLRHGALRLRHGWTVFGAWGQGGVERVVIGRVDAAGEPVFGTEQEVVADLCAVGFGLIPAAELAIRAGCAMRHDETRGGWVPEHDGQQETSVPGIYVAGEIAGVAGAKVAMIEGALAGRAMARSLGLSHGPLADLQEQRRCQRRISDALLRAARVPAGLSRLAQPSTLLCRCEDVNFTEVAAAARLHGADQRSIKMATRAGMGPCQGRICHSIVHGQLRHRCGGVEATEPCPRVQIPVKPVAIQTLIEAQP